MRANRRRNTEPVLAVWWQLHVVMKGYWKVVLLGGGLVLTGVFGLQVGLDGTVTASGGCIESIDPGARLEGLQVQGRLYDIVAGQVT